MSCICRAAYASFAHVRSRKLTVQRPEVSCKAARNTTDRIGFPLISHFSAMQYEFHTYITQTCRDVTKREANRRSIGYTVSYARAVPSPFYTCKRFYDLPRFPPPPGNSSPVAGVRISPHTPHSRYNRGGAAEELRHGGVRRTARFRHYYFFISFRT